MTKVASVLESIRANAGGEAALLVAAEGKILVSTAADGDATLTSLASYAANYVSVSERMGEDTQRGVTQALILIYRGKAMVLAPLGRSAFALVVGSRHEHLGNLRYQLRRGIGDLVRAVSEEMPDLHLEVRSPLAERPPSPIKPTPPPEAPKAPPRPTRPPIGPRPHGIGPHRDGKERPAQTPGLPANRITTDSPASKGVQGPKDAAPPAEKPLADVEASISTAPSSKPEAPAPPHPESRPEPVVPPSAKPAAMPKADGVTPASSEKGIRPKPDEVTPAKPAPPPEATSVKAPSPASAPEATSAKTPSPASAPQPPPEPREEAVAETAPSGEDVNVFLARVRDMIEKMQTHPGAFSIAVLALEGFHEITPPLPRPARSALIQVCGERLRKALRSVDLAVQFKDGTFGLLLAGVRSNQARAVVQRVTTQVLDGNLEQPKGAVAFRLRSGIATYPEGGASAERLLRRATTALFISQIEGAMGDKRTPHAEFSVAVLSLEGQGKDNESQSSFARGFAIFVQRLERTLRAVDVATQLDDHKYGLLLTGVNHAQASAIVERIKDQILKDNLGVPTKEATFRLRAGIATYPEAGPLADGLLYHAESSLTFLAP